MPLRSNKEHDADDWVTMSFRVKHKHALQIHAAAEQARDGISTAARMRKLVLEWMAEELGVPVPDYSTSELNQEDVASVARGLGMTPREFMSHAARELAASMRQQAGKPAQAPPKGQAQRQPQRPQQPHDSSASGLRPRASGSGKRRKPMSLRRSRRRG